MPWMEGGRAGTTTRLGEAQFFQRITHQHKGAVVYGATALEARYVHPRIAGCDYVTSSSVKGYRSSDESVESCHGSTTIPLLV